MSRVSIIIPIYKVEKYLKKCLDSVLAQTFDDFDVILIDDGSPDKCGKICDEYAKKDKRVHVLHQKNQGVSVARNVGIEWAINHSDSEWIGFVDSDDWLHPQYLEFLVMPLYNSDIQISQCDSVDIKDGESIILEEQKEKTYSCVIPEEAYFVRGGTVVMRRLYKKELFREIRFPYGKRYEDEYVMYRVVFSVEKIAIVNAPLYYYTLREESFMHDKWSVVRLDMLGAYEEQLRFFKENNLNKAYDIVLRNYLVGLGDGYYNLCKIKHENKDVKYLRKKARKAISVYRKKANITIKNYPAIYEAAYPNVMKGYWFLKAILRKVRGKKCQS